MALEDKRPRRKGKKNRKHGRNSAVCKSYRLSNRREKNKAKKVAKHLAKNPHDLAAKELLARLKKY